MKMVMDIRIMIIPVKNNPQWYLSGMKVAKMALKSWSLGNINSFFRKFPWIIIYPKSIIKVYNINPAPIKSSKSSYGLRRSFFWRNKIHSNNIAAPIIIAEHITGARTGPIQVIGIRNKMSQVKKDSGQFKKTFSPI